MFLAWVEVRATQPHTNSDGAVSPGDHSHSSAMDETPGRMQPNDAACGLVEKEFPGLRAARAWAAKQLTQRADVTGNVAVFETEGPLVRLAWRRESSPAVPSRARRRRSVSQPG